MTAAANRACLVLLAAATVAACGEPQTPAERPKPRTVTRDAVGYYCNMIVQDHLGPKGQVILAGSNEVVWFTSARDTLAFLLLPEESKQIAAVYVSDLGAAAWQHPEHQPGAWVDATVAWYVIGSDRLGGMGQAEAVPFRDPDAAQSFVRDHGGTVVPYAQVPRHYILGSH